MTGHARPAEGKFLTPVTKVLLLVAFVGAIAALYRLVNGLGAATAMNDGYPWGIWIAFDVVVGTGLASGGYAMALLVFIFNKGRYHPLVRPALVTSFLGYSLAGVAIVLDLGRFWNMWRIPLSVWDWNGTSILLEVALCMMAYTAVLFLEASPALLERWRDGARAERAAFAQAWLPRIERALPFLVALGLVLPTMHQSSLGSLLLVAGTKLHPLWHTALLPLLYLLTAISMGYAVIHFESIFSSLAFGRRMETRLLSRVGVFVGGILLAFLAVRFSGLFAADRLGLTLRSGSLSFFFWGETLLCGAAAFLFMQQGVRASASGQLQAALLALAAAALYRVDTFLVAFDPGANWVYFPSLGELLVTLGFVAGEAVAYAWIVRKFPILAGVTVPATRTAPAGAIEEGAAS